MVYMSSTCIFNLSQIIFLIFKICKEVLILIDYFPGSHNKVFKNFAYVRSYVLEKVKNIITLDINNFDFIDCFLIKMEQGKMLMTDWLSICLKFFVH